LPSVRTTRRPRIIPPNVAPRRRQNVDWTTAGIRALSCFLSLLPLGLGFLWIAFDRDRQAWHDKVAGTVVIRVPRGVSLA
jgi:uncharacterized RDD family membrane protein YckC